MLCSMTVLKTIRRNESNSPDSDVATIALVMYNQRHEASKELHKWQFSMYKITSRLKEALN